MNALIADASPVYRKIFARAVSAVLEGVSVSFAKNREEALDKARSGRYRLVVLDAGIAAGRLSELLNAVLSNNPGAVVLVVSPPSRSADAIFAESFSHGAASCLLKPIYDSYDDNLTAAKNEIRHLFTEIPRSNVIGQISDFQKHKPAAENKGRALVPEIVLIAASTGGPAALAVILSSLKESFPAPILVVQHTTPYFTETLSVALSKKTKLNVKVAESGEIAAAGTVYIAPGERHMRLDSKTCILLDSSEPINGVRPSADALFDSAAETLPDAEILSVVLTGMGRDGERGLARLKSNRNCFCIAQSEKTCVVYGMPRAVVDAGLADTVLDIEKIAGKMESFYAFKGETDVRMT